MAKRTRAPRYRLAVWSEGGCRLFLRRLTEREMVLIDSFIGALNMPLLIGNDCTRFSVANGLTRIVIREDMRGDDR